MRVPNEPTIEECRALLALAEWGSERKAARQLKVGQPVVHRRLRVFRQGHALVTPEANRVQLTAAGRTALPAVRRLVRDYERLRQFMSGQSEHARSLTLAVGSSITQFYLAGALAELRERLDGWTIETRVARGRDRIVGVVNGTFDLAIVSHSPEQIDGTARAAGHERVELSIEPVARLPYCVIAKKGTPLARTLESVLAGQAVTWELLARSPLAGLDQESGIRQQLETAWRRHTAGRTGPRTGWLQFAIQAGGWLGVKEFVRQGLCGGIIPLAVLTLDETKQLVVRRLPDDAVVEHHLVHRADVDNEALTSAKAALIRTAQEHNAAVERVWRGKL